jgi:hypothetical protein
MIIKGELMKTALSKLMRNEKGQALPIVLVLLLMGGLFTSSLLGYMGTGLIAGQVFEGKMKGLYAADAGIEDALWKLDNGYAPTGNLTDVNGMDVTVVELIPSVVTGNSTLYTLQSTAYLGAEIKAEIVSQVEVVLLGAVAAGGGGGEYQTNPEMVALSLVDGNSIIFTTQQPNARFKGWGDAAPGAQFDPDDLWSLNMAAGIGALYFDNDAVIASPDKINGVHYYQDGGYDTLLMTIEGTANVGVNSIPVTKSDIFKLHIDPDDSQQWEAESLYTIPDAADVVAVSARGLGDNETANDIILFSISVQATLGGTQFDKGDVIKFSGGTYTSLINVNDILGLIPGNPANLVLDALAVLPAPDERLLLSFTVGPVTGNDGELIQNRDIAIWDPDTNTINLHIGMDGQTMPAGSATSVSIVTWEID